jgi:predicted phosphodiesterase
VRYGLISDIHANLEALDAVLRHLDAARVDEIVCLGDLVGYHASPNECVARVRASCAHVIAGNHDRAVVGTLATTEFNFAARRAVRWTAARISAEHAAYLRALPIAAPLTDDVRLVHGALAPEPNDRFHITTPARIAANLEILRAAARERLCWFGHTHRAAVYGSDGVARDVRAGRIALADGYYLINPGSVGQPRDGDWRAACAVYDANARTLEFARVEYDADAFRAKAAGAGLLAPPSFARRTYEAARARVVDTADTVHRILAKRSRARAPRR